MGNNQLLLVVECLEVFDMKNYIALIRRDDFTDLFKYGKIYIDHRKSSELPFPVEELGEHPELFNEISKYNNSFDHGMAYILLQYDKNDEDFDIINIEEVKHLYPLDYESKKIFETTFDQRIRLENPFWPNVVEELQKIRTIDNCNRGVENIKTIVGLENKVGDKDNGIITDELIREFVDQLYSDQSPSGKLSLWTYLLRYSRHSFYPKNILGSFYDAVNVIFNAGNEQEIDDTYPVLNNSNIYKLLSDLERQGIYNKFDKIYEILLYEAVPFLDLIKKFESRVDFLKVAVIFFELKNLVNNDFIYDEKNKGFIDKVKVKYPEEFKEAISLLGLWLGHEHTYDAFYSKLPLPIFKANEEETINLPIDIIQEEENSPSSFEEYILQDDTNIVSEPTVDSLTQTINSYEKIREQFNGEDFYMCKLTGNGKPNGRTKRKIDSERKYKKAIEDGLVIYHQIKQKSLF